MDGRKVFRNGTMVFGAAAIIIATTGCLQSSVFLAVGLAGLFLGATDFGRRCPLLLSVRHFLSRMKRKY